ncbi:hypothetical protein KP77_25600 [Jeotgalibacillus alimentarius]|uniref:Integrase n=1 Tax=Jeotgalibacillus alimentarius TaxID=135826 RepID=A0A0C2VR28_9BACL|nr:site-specific integrase [Jeotgalibacillus alimentarius]KIL46433.1 hypothetical protein KP77_25600 [Jeotgalibacillus alimentarius]
MHCRKVKTKKGEVWECMDDAPPHPVTGKRRRVSARDKNRGVCKSKVEKKIEQLTEHGLLVAGSKANITFEQLANLWLKEVTTGSKSSTKYSYAYHIKRFNKYVSKIDVRSFTRKMYQNVLNEMSRDEYAENTIINAHSTAKKIFHQAVIWDILKDSPAEYARVPKKLKTVEEIETNEVEEMYFNPADLERFLKASIDVGLKDDAFFIYTLSFTGMRIGEISALTEQDINFDTNEIRVSKTLYNISGDTSKYEITVPKTTTSARYVSFGPKLSFVLKKQINQMKEEILANGPDFNQQRFLSVNEKGNPRTPRFIHYRVSRLKAKLSYKGKVHPHKFRHTHTSLLAEAGVQLHVIMSRMGHADSATTKKIYLHVTKSAKENAPLTVEEKYKNMLDF